MQLIDNKHTIMDQQAFKPTFGSKANDPLNLHISDFESTKDINDCFNHKERKQAGKQLRAPSQTHIK